MTTVSGALFYRERIALLPGGTATITAIERATVTWSEFLRSQAARNLFLRHSDQLADAKALVRDLGSQSIDAFDEVFRTEHMKILKTPVRTPVANAFAERWTGTLRELLDRTLIWNRRQLERLVADYIEHYNTHRPHRSLGHRPPAGGVDEQPPAGPLQVMRSTRCDGLINEYRNAA